MSFFVKPEPGPIAAAPSPASFIDILYDHAGYLRANNGKLGSGNLSSYRVAIVGSGAAGLLAAYLLMQLRANVTIFEASNRYGGRIYSLKPIPGDAAIFELGAMRVPPSEQLFSYFANLFGMAPATFPDPGKVDTKIIYENQTYDYPAGGNPPPVFNNVSTGWKNFVSQPPITTLNGLLTNPSNFDQAQSLWQQLVYQAAPPGPEQGYSTISFYQGLVQTFVENYSKYGLQQPWSTNDFALFGALGLGSGGFGPLYEVSFAEIVRLVINGLETNQQFYGGGLGALVDGIANSRPDPVTPKRVADCIQYNSRVASVAGSESGFVNVTLQNGDVFPAHAAIIATTTRSMQVDMGLTDPTSGTLVLDASANTGIRELHLMNSSKLFVLTKTKFWLNTGLPQNIQTDGLVRGLYCLDYKASSYGVVLISYTWGDDSTKYIAVKQPNERLAILLDSLQAAVPDFVNALRAQILPQYTTLVDWQDQLDYFGAFKLNYPGQDPYCQSLYTHFLRSRNGVYMAGDSISWSGGWIEGALQTGMNAAAAVAQQLRAALFPNNPTTQNSNLYNYGP